MGLLKLAWAGGVKTIGATSGTNRGVKFQVQHLFWLLGIHVGSIDDAFSSRALEFELQKIPGSEKWTNFRAPSPSEMSTLQTQTLAVALHCCQEARIAASKLSADKTGSEHVHDRTRVSLATCAALIAAIDGQGEQVAKDLIVRWAAERITDQADQTKSEDVLDSILDLTIPVGHGGQVSAATILRGDRDDYSDAIDQLETQIGIKWVNGNHGKYLAVNCKRTFAHLPKSLNINNSRALSQVLLSLCRGVRPKVTHIAGAKRQCVQIPAEVVNSSLFDN